MDTQGSSSRPSNPVKWRPSGHSRPISSSSIIRGARSGASSSRPSTEHSYCLAGRNKAPWLTLKVMSAATTVSQLPNIFGGDTISGQVLLDLEREDSIRSISVMVLGQMTTSVSDVYNFLELSTELWSRTTPSKSDSKLRGSHAWPFSLELPRLVNLRFAGGELKEYHLPPSFSERLARVHIQYQLVALVRRGKLRINSRVGTVISYTPLVQPDPPSVLRQTAYRDRTPLIGPTGDPDGWESLPPFAVQGLAFGSRTVDVLLTLWLAKPLCYTRGSVIPCALLIDSEDIPTLESLTHPASINVRLIRHLKPSHGNSTATTAHSAADGGAGDLSSQDIKTASWWPSAQDPNAGPCKRSLSGEIALAAGLKPSCRLGEFALSYSVALCPPRTASFAPTSDAGSVLCSVIVKIATAYSVGPRPVTYADEAGRT